MFFRRLITLATLPLLSAHLVAGCSRWSTSESIRQDVNDRNGRARVRVTLRDLRTLEVDRAVIRDGKLVGIRTGGMTKESEGGVRYVRGEPVEIPLSSITRMELRVHDSTKTGYLIGGISLIVVGGGILIYGVSQSFQGPLIGAS